uniref:DUF4283 domain-containing protein n=1 Tax=Cannabis sativa TaxID=3483 RepID=A0A803NMT2_CANSA
MDDQYASMTLDEEEMGGLQYGEEDEGLSEIDDRWFLVGRFITDREIDFLAMQHKMASLWRPGRGLYVKELKPNLYLFQFYHEIDVGRVIKGSPWTFDRIQLGFQRLRRGEKPRSVILKKLDFWVQLHGMSKEFMSQRVVKDIGNYIGVFVESDHNNFMGIWRDYLRIRVSIRVDQPLKKENETKEVFDTPSHLLPKPYNMELKAAPRRRNHTIGSRWLRTADDSKNNGKFSKGETSGGFENVQRSLETERRPTVECEHPPSVNRDIPVVEIGNPMNQGSQLLITIYDPRSTGNIHPITTLLDGKGKKQIGGILGSTELIQKNYVSSLDAKRKRMSFDTSDGPGENSSGPSLIIMDSHGPYNEIGDSSHISLKEGGDTLMIPNKDDNPKNLNGGGPWFSSPPRVFIIEAQGRSGGLALLWKTSEEGQVVGYSHHHIDFTVKMEGKPEWRLTGVYARQEGGLPYPQALLQGFQQALSDCELTDMELLGYLFTWERGRGTTNWAEIRLDHALISADWFCLFPQAKLSNLETSPSDHSPILLEPVLETLHIFFRTTCAEVVDEIKCSIFDIVNHDLLLLVSKEEVRKALFQMHPSKSPGPDGTTPGFYQKCWNIVRSDVVNVVHRFFQRRGLKMDISNANVVLIPKKRNPEHVTDLRPIALCDVIYKIITKVMANRMKPFMDKAVSVTQSTFIPGRLISDNILVSFEVLHYLKRKRQGKEGGAFSALIKKYENRGWIHGCKVANGAPRITHMLFADDNYLYCKATAPEAVKVRELLAKFENASGQQVSLNKSSIFYSINTSEATRMHLNHVLQMRQANENSTYLGLPSTMGRNKTDVLGYLKDRVRKRLQGWEGTFLSRAGKEILVKTVAQTLPSYAMSVFLLPLEISIEIEKLMAKFWWKSSLKTMEEFIGCLGKNSASITMWAEWDSGILIWRF